MYNSHGDWDMIVSTLNDKKIDPCGSVGSFAICSIRMAYNFILFFFYFIVCRATNHMLQNYVLNVQFRFNNNWNMLVSFTGSFNDNVWANRSTFFLFAWVVVHEYTYIVGYTFFFFYFFRIKLLKYLKKKHVMGRWHVSRELVERTREV